MAKPALHEEHAGEVSRCGCGASIIWAHTAAGKRMPLSVKTHEHRLVAFERKGRIEARYLSTYESHFADCPNANLFRKED